MARGCVHFLATLSLSKGEELDHVFFELESGLAHSKVMGKLCGDEEREKGEDWVLTDTLAHSHTRIVTHTHTHMHTYTHTRTHTHTHTQGEYHSRTILQLFSFVENGNDVCGSIPILCFHSHFLLAYLDSVTEMLLYIVLPEEDFHNTALRYLLRVCAGTQAVDDCSTPQFVHVWSPTKHSLLSLSPPPLLLPPSPPPLLLPSPPSSSPPLLPSSPPSSSLRMCCQCKCYNLW